MPIERINVNGRMGSMATIPVFDDMYEIIWDDGERILFRKAKKDPPSEDSRYPLISANDLPEVIEHLRSGTGDPRYAVLMFLPKDSTEDDYVNLQYAVANGVIGLEWVLLGDRNIRDKKAVVAFARALGCALLPSKMNGVKFLRYEGPDLVKLGRAIVPDFYSFGPTEKVELLAEGFSWQ